jgi:hypothetical protein
MSCGVIGNYSSIDCYFFISPKLQSKAGKVNTGFGNEAA